MNKLLGTIAILWCDRSFFLSFTPHSWQRKELYFLKENRSLTDHSSVTTHNSPSFPRDSQRVLSLVAIIKNYFSRKRSRGKIDRSPLPVHNSLLFLQVSSRVSLISSLDNKEKNYFSLKRERDMTNHSPVSGLKSFLYPGFLPPPPSLTHSW